jgi:isovaleryl-CoA dehydrogenase
MNHLPGLAFDLGETIEMLRDTVQSFASQETAPRVAQLTTATCFPPTCGKSSATWACTA